MFWYVRELCLHSCNLCNLHVASLHLEKTTVTIISKFVIKIKFICFTWILIYSVTHLNTHTLVFLTHCNLIIRCFFLFILYKIKSGMSVHATKTPKPTRAATQELYVMIGLYLHLLRRLGIGTAGVCFKDVSFKKASHQWNSDENSISEAASAQTADLWMKPLIRAGGGPRDCTPQDRC